MASQSLAILNRSRTDCAISCKCCKNLRSMRSKCNQNHDVNSLSSKISCANCLADYSEVFKNCEYMDFVKKPFLTKSNQMICFCFVST